MQTLKTSQFYYQAEPDFWLAMTVNAPYDTRTKEGGEYKEFKSDTVHGKIYRSVLEESYKMFRLFYGKFEESFIGDTPEEKSLALQSKLEDFFSVVRRGLIFIISKLLTLTALPFQYLRQLMVHNCDMINAFRSIQYLPLEQKLFLRIHNFVNSIESIHPVIKHCVVLHKERIIWSGLKPDHLYTFNEYLSRTLMPSINEDFLTMAVNGMTDNSRFVVGPGRCERKPIPMYIYNEAGVREDFYMILFSAKNMICCLLLGEIDRHNNNNCITNLSHLITQYSFLDKLEPEEFYAELQVPLNTQLVAISAEIDQFLRSTPTTSGTMSPKLQQSSSIASATPSPKYLYLNECNLLHNGSLTGKNGGLPRDLINILMDLYEETDERDISEEAIVKTMNDYWIFRKNCNSRCFFVLINKYATLIEISDEATKLYGQHVQDVFFE